MNLGPLKNSGSNLLTLLYWGGVSSGPLKLPPQRKSWSHLCAGRYRRENETPDP